VRLLITGASGFIGRNVLRALPTDWDVVATYHRSADFPEFVENEVETSVRSVQVDLTQPDEVSSLAAINRSYDACLFLAANGDPAVSVAKPRLDLLSNAASLVTLLEAVPVKRFVYFSSGAVYDHLEGPVGPGSAVAPTLPYAISKLAAEHYLRHFEHAGQLAQYVAVRFFGAYGPYEPKRKIYGRLIQQFKFRGDPGFTIRGDGNNLIDAMYIDDAVRGILTLLTANHPSSTLDLSCHAAITLTELVERAAKVFDLEASITYEGDVPEYIRFYSYDTTMREIYGFEPSIPLEAGLELQARWMSSR
jgi:UDP-glucose 4-epimerase